MAGLRRRSALAAGLVSLLVPQAARAQAAMSFAAADLAHARALRDAALKSTLAYTLVESLLTEVGARAAGSPNDARAVQWALEQCTRLGLANVRAEPVPLLAWQRGPASALLLAPQPHPLVITALGNSVATPAAGLEAELVYYADLAALRADQSEQARGRVVFIDQKTERAKDGSGYSRAALARVAGAVEAGRRGAAAVAIRSIGTDRDRIAHTGALRYDPQVAAIPALAVSVPDAELIGRLHRRGTPLRLRLNLQATSKVAATSHNVIAEVPGTDLAEEIVLIGAHLDSWDISPGALDNGAGVGIVLSAAKALLDAGQRPRRTVRVVLFANEENGFDGALAYGERYKNVVHQLVGESDFGSGLAWRLRARVHGDALPALGALAEVLQPLGIAWADSPAAPGPDAAMLVRSRGWPAIELTQDGTHYFDVHHTENDTLDKIDPATLPQNTAAWAVAAWLAAQSPVRFGGGAR